MIYNVVLVSAINTYEHNYIYPLPSEPPSQLPSHSSRSSRLTFKVQNLQVKVKGKEISHVNMHSNQPTSTESTETPLVVANVPCVRCCYMQFVGISEFSWHLQKWVLLFSFTEVNWEIKFYMTCPDHFTNKAQSTRTLNQMGSRGQDPHLSRTQ